MRAESAVRGEDRWIFAAVVEAKNELHFSSFKHVWSW
jgi:hypothetical protein